MTPPATCPNGHAMDDGLFHCPACGAYRPSAAGRTTDELSLRIHHPDAEPYPLDRFMLDEAIEAEATNVVSEATSEHLSENSEHARDLLHAQVVREATAALREEGDEYRDPIGIRWSLVA